MSPQLVLDRGSIKRKLLDIRFGPYFLIASLVVFVCLLTMVTLAFSTDQVTKGYTLSKLDSEQQELIKQREIKDMQLSKVRALASIKSSTKAMAMVRPRTVAYMTGGNVVVSR